MKITLNLAALPRPRERYALAWAVPLVVLGLAGLAILSGVAATNFIEYRAVKRDISLRRNQSRLLEERAKTLRQDLEKPRPRELAWRAQFLNSLIDQKSLSVAELAGKVAGLVPARARLTGLALAQEKEGPVARFSVEARDEEAMENFLDNLESSPDFQDVAILNEGFGSETAEEGGVTVICTARYLVGRTL
jgi:Tfp pilus assembly protein PilN